jgi:hypothetical protein
MLQIDLVLIPPLDSGPRSSFAGTLRGLSLPQPAFSGALVV